MAQNFSSKKREVSLNVTEDWLSVIFRGCRVHEYLYTVMFVVLY